MGRGISILPQPMNAGDWAQVAIACIMLLATVAAVVTAYVNYRTRPLLIRTKELHSENLKGLLEQWRVGIDSQGIPDIRKPLDSAIDFSLPTESSILFSDLVNHIPRELDLFGEWDAFKKQRRQVDDKRVAMYQSIKSYLKRYSRLDVISPFSESAIGISHHCADYLLESVMVKAEGGGIRRQPRFQIENLPNGWSIIRYSGDYWARCKSESSVRAFEELLLMTLTQVDQDEPGPAAYDLLTEARDLIADQEKLRELQRRLIIAIETVKAIPILTGDCEYIARAKEPFWPWHRR